MPSTTKSEQLIKQTETFGANNYHPLPIFLSEAEVYLSESN
jgi:ornithine--oxo-acid transaminase